MYDTISQALEGGMDRQSAMQMLQEVVSEAQQYVLVGQTRQTVERERDFEFCCEIDSLRAIASTLFHCFDVGQV